MKKIILFLSCLVVFYPHSLQANTCNIIVLSAKTLDKAQKLAEVYQNNQNFTDIKILKKGKWFMVSVLNGDKNEVAKQLKQLKKAKILPKSSKYTCKKYQIISSKNSTVTNTSSKKATEDVVGSPLIKTLNTAINNYLKEKKRAIQTYKITEEALNALLVNPTAENLKNNEQQVQKLLIHKNNLIILYYNMYDLYTEHKSYFQKIKNGNVISQFIDVERSFINSIPKQVTLMKEKLCRSEKFKCGATQ